MTQLGLLGWSPPLASSKAPEQAQQAARVGKGIDEVVVEAARAFAGPEPFSMSAFTEWVGIKLRHVGRMCGPDSPRRRLSALVAQGLIDAECVDRSRSLWVVRAVREEGR